MDFRQCFSILYAFMVYLEYFFKGDGIIQAMPINGTINANAILIAFCRLEHKLNVIECVDQETDGQALVPWHVCLNVDAQLSKNELITLSCTCLYPGYKEVLEILTTCVDALMMPEEAATWLASLTVCANAMINDVETITANITENIPSINMIY